MTHGFNMSDASKKDIKKVSDLTAEDIKRLMSNETSDAKYEVTEKISHNYCNGIFTKNQKKVAEDIFRVLIKDAAQRIRETLSQYLKDASHAPKDIIQALANDISNVAIPVLLFSEVLEDDDLLSVIDKSDDTDKHMAIAKRDNLSPNITKALIDLNEPYVAEELLKNETAHINDEGMTHLIDNFTDKKQILSLMVAKKPKTMVMEYLAKVVSDGMYRDLAYEHTSAFNYISNKLGLTKEENMFQHLSHESTERLNSVNEVLQQSRELATIKLGGMRSHDKQVKDIVSKLNLTGQISPVFALSVADMELFMVSIARLASISVANARMLILDASNNGMNALYSRVDLPEELREAIVFTVESLRVVYEQLSDTEVTNLSARAELLVGKLKKKLQSSSVPAKLEVIAELIENNIMTEKVRHELWDN